MAKFEKIVRIICSYPVIPCAFLMVGWVFIFAAYIIGRLFGLRWMFVEEFTGYWLVFLAYIPLSYALMTETHIKIEMVSSRLPEVARSILQVCTDGIALVLTSYLVGRSIEWLIHGIEYGTRSGTIMNVLRWPIYLFIPIGLALFALMLIVKIGHSVMEWKQARRTYELRRLK